MSVSTITVVDSAGVTRTIGVLPDQVSGRTPVEPLGAVGEARQVAANATSGGAAVTLTATCTRISIVANGAKMRFAIGTAPTASRTTSHYIAADERLDISVPAGSKIAVATDANEGSVGTLEVTELVNPS